jgi:hypothetical protein
VFRRKREEMFGGGGRSNKGNFRMRWQRNERSVQQELKHVVRGEVRPKPNYTICLGN